MKIGLLTSDLTYKHGWGTYSLSIIKTLIKHQQDLTILTARNSQTISEIVTHPVLPAVAPQEHFTLPKMLLWRNKIAHLLADCDVIHTTIEVYAPLMGLIAKKRPTFMTAHGSYINLPKIRSFPANFIYQRAFERTTIICVSNYTERIVRQIAPKAETKVIFNAVDAAHFVDIEPQRTPSPTIMTLGGVKRRKGTLELVKAVDKVRESIPDVQCVVLGATHAEPNYVQRVREMIDKLHLQDTVHLLGFVDDMTLRQWYAKADVFALPSVNDSWKFEGFGLATLEASAAGLPVIGTTDCGAEDAIEHGVTGLLVSQDNLEQELPQALLTLLTNQDKAEQMGKAGRQKALSYTWDDVGQQLITLYESHRRG